MESPHLDLNVQVVDFLCVMEVFIPQKNVMLLSKDRANECGHALPG